MTFLSLFFSHFIFCSFQVFMCLEKPVCTPPCLSKVSPTLPLKQFQCLCNWWWPSLVHSRKGRLSSTSSFHASPLQVIDGVMSLALCPQVVSRASQHFRSSEKQAPCEGCFASHSRKQQTAVYLSILITFLCGFCHSIVVFYTKAEKNKESKPS